MDGTCCGPRGIIWRQMMDALGYDAIAFPGNSSGTALVEPEHGEGDGKAYTVVAVRRSDQIKSADLVTYDNRGHIIPLSKRFSGHKDIRMNPRRSR
jgi:hypothetical protein